MSKFIENILDEGAMRIPRAHLAGGAGHLNESYDSMSTGSSEYTIKEEIERKMVTSENYAGLAISVIALASVMILAQSLASSNGPRLDFLNDSDFEKAEQLTSDEIFGKHIPVEVVNAYKSDIRNLRRRQKVLSLDNGCMEYATIIHEMMHVVGFYHEHAATIGNAKDFSEVDLAKINRMYNCPHEKKELTAPFARAQHSPIYVPINKYDDRPKMPSPYYDSLQNINNKPASNNYPTNTIIH
uniref:Astacin domain-containing protein n=1 Tax=Heterorhabditis bacteriophora TaxID=37862 RepID=A0A1I7XT11_HETBA